MEIQIACYLSHLILINLFGFCWLGGGEGWRGSNNVILPGKGYNYQKFKQFLAFLQDQVIYEVRKN